MSGCSRPRSTRSPLPSQSCELAAPEPGDDGEMPQGAQAVALDRVEESTYLVRCVHGPFWRVVLRALDGVGRFVER